MNGNNVIHLRGNVAKKVQDLTKTKDKPVAKILLVTDHGYFDDDNNWQEDNDIHYITAFGTAAQKVLKHVRKGHEIYIVGRLATHTYETKKGKTKYQSEIQVSSASFVQFSQYNSN